MIERLAEASVKYALERVAIHDLPRLQVRRQMPDGAVVSVVWTGSGKNKLRAGRRLKVAPFPESKSILDVVAVL
jgi:hypothetical protein